MAHLQRLVDLSATMNQRGTLLLEAMRAAYVDEGKSPDRLELAAMKKSIFDAGMWSEAMLTAEFELCERLLYTPEQYLEKKAMREQQAQASAQLAAMMEDFAPSSEPQAQP